MNDFLIASLSATINASKSRDYRAQVLSSFKTFVNFLQCNNLTTRLIVADINNIPEDCKIMKSDLTEEGFNLVRNAYDKWLRAHDRGKSPEDTTILEKELKKLRG